MNEVIKPIRFEKEYIVFENQYRRLNKSQHDKMHKTRNEKTNSINKDINEDIKTFCKQKYMSEFALEMDRSGAEYIKKFRTSK